MSISKNISAVVAIVLGAATLFLVAWYAGYQAGYAADARYWDEHPRHFISDNCGWKL